jgi:poly(hydroxyalkanoate) depolymerase family esterase
MIRKAMAGLVSFAALAAGVFGQSQNLTMQIGGAARKYILYAPSGLPANPPLVYVIHGFNMTAQQMVGITKMNTLADKGKFLVVYPDALLNGSNEPSWDMSGQNDYNFLLAIIDSVDAKYHIDRNKVYASGFSQGGFMSFQLGCRYADKFAAIAPVSGLLSGSCKPSRTVPMFLTFGTADVATPASFMQSLAAWVKLAECPTTPKVTSPYPATNANSLVTRIEYGPCKDGTAVMADSVKGGPHEWPMDTRTKVNNSEEVWAFFQKYSLKGASGIGRFPPAAGERNISATFANGKVRVRGAGEGAAVRILDSRGKRVASAPAGRTEIDFTGMPGGVYQILVDGDGNSYAVKLAVP